MPHEGYADPITNDGPRLNSDIPHSQLAKCDTRAIEASVVSSTPPVVEAEDGVTRETWPTPYQTPRGSGARAARSEIKRLRFEGWPAKGPRPPRVKQEPGEKNADEPQRPSPIPH